MKKKCIYNKIIKDFICFLIERKCYHLYLESWSCFRHTRHVNSKILHLSLHDWLMKLLFEHNNNNDSQFINYMASWNEAPRGFSFWLNKHDDWEKRFRAKLHQYANM